MLLLQKRDATLLNTPLGPRPFISNGLNISAQSPETLRLQTELEVSIIAKCPTQRLHIQLLGSVHKQALWTEIFLCEMQASACVLAAVEPFFFSPLPNIQKKRCVFKLSF